MKFTDTNGREHAVDIRPSRWKRKEVGEGRGLYQSKVGDLLAAQFPADIVLEEFPCSGEGLFLDFFLPRSKIAIEVQGAQHKRFVAFFHNSQADFRKQKERDARKELWCEINNIKLLKIDWGEKEENIKKVLG